MPTEICMNFQSHTTARTASIGIERECPQLSQLQKAGMGQKYSMKSTVSQLSQLSQSKNAAPKSKRPQKPQRNQPELVARVTHGQRLRCGTSTRCEYLSLGAAALALGASWLFPVCPQFLKYCPQKCPLMPPERGKLMRTLPNDRNRVFIGKKKKVGRY